MTNTATVFATIAFATIAIADLEMVGQNWGRTKI
jgi:hypothetical protein